MIPARRRSQKQPAVVANRPLLIMSALRAAAEYFWFLWVGLQCLWADFEVISLFRGLFRMRDPVRPSLSAPFSYSTFIRSNLVLHEHTHHGEV
jgi:hypothetical protein